MPSRFRMMTVLIALVPTVAASAQPLTLPTAPTDRPRPIEPLVPRSEADEDRVLASAHLAEARLMFRREAYPEALASYQRAFRYGNGARTVLDEVVTLAFRLGRLDEAGRYCQFLDVDNRVDPFILRRLAIHLTEQQRLDQALRLYGLTLVGREAAEEGDGGLITHFEMGRLNYLQANYPEAASHFDLVWKALQNPDQVSPADRPVVDALEKEASTTYALIAEAMFEAGKTEQAQAAYRQAYRDQPDAPILAYHQARIADVDGRPQDALRQLQVYLDSGATTAGMAPYATLAKLLDQLPEEKRQADMLQRLASLVETQPTNTYVAYFLGEHLLFLDRPEAAAEVFERLMTVQPLLDAYQGIVLAYYEQGQANTVVIRLVEVARALGDLSRLADVVAAVGQDDAFWTAMQVWADDWLAGKLDLGLNAPAERWRVAQVMAEIASAAGRGADADRYFRAAVEMADPPDRTIWLAWGLERLASDAPERAIEVFRGMLRGEGQRQPDAGLVRYYLAAALTLDEQYDEALRAAQQAAEQLSEIPAIQVRPAWVLLLAGRREEAYAAYAQFLAATADGAAEPALIREVKSTLSGLAVQLGRFAEAEEWLEQVLDEFPMDIGALNDLGYLWADRGVHRERALRMVERAVNAEPDNVAYRDSLGWALFRLGRFQEAVVELKIAAAADPPDGVILDHLGDALCAAGEHQEALEAWRRAAPLLGAVDADRQQQVEAKINELSQPQGE